MKFEQAVDRFETSAFKFVNTVFRAKQKIFMFGTKNTLFVYFVL